MSDIFNKLKPIDPKQVIESNKRLMDVSIIPRAVTCEGCGYVITRRDEAINIILNIGSPGHPDLPPFQCPGGGDSYGDHWACSIECLSVIALDCINNHMASVLRYLHGMKGIDLEKKKGT